MNSRYIEYGKLLQGYYEDQRLPKDLSSMLMVPDFAFNILNPLGLLYRPVVDESYIENDGIKPTWPENRPFAVCLTHDVDVVSMYSFKKSIRARRLQLSKNNDLANAAKGLMGVGLDALQAGYMLGRDDPIHCYERWLEIEKEVDAHSTFFFWPGWENVTRRHRTDCIYKLSDRIVFDGQKCTVGEMICEIDRRGWEIGLHASWHTFADLNEMKRQKQALEKVIGHEIVSVRQHYLHYDIRRSPRVQTDAGFKYDSTLGFNDNVGFRFGTCYPWQLYDLKDAEELSITEIPLIIQDGALLNKEKGMRLDEETAFQYIEQITKAVEKVGGILTLLWHPNYIIKSEWWRLYLRLLDFVKKKNVWFCCIREAGEWWKSCEHGRKNGR